MFPSGHLGWDYQQSGVSNIMTPNSALGKAGDSIPREEEIIPSCHGALHPQPLYGPAEVILVL